MAAGPQPHRRTPNLCPQKEISGHLGWEEPRRPEPTCYACSPPRFLIRTRAGGKVDSEGRAGLYCRQSGGRGENQDQAVGVYQDISHPVFRDCQTQILQLLVARRFSFAFLSLILRTTPWHGDLLHLIEEETGIQRGTCGVPKQRELSLICQSPEHSH